MQIEDFSSLKPVGDIEVPLNGAIYYADPNPPSDVVLTATGATTLHDGDVEAIGQVMAAGDDENAVPPAVMGIAIKAGQAATLRSLQFLQDVLRPESAARWAANMKVQRNEAGEVVDNPQAITLAQCMAVVRALLAVYSGRPTVPPSPSANGHGGTGETSTAGLPLGG